MWARFTVLSDTPIASAIVGCVIPLSRSNTIWMRWRCSGCPFQPSAVFKRRICFLVHLTICLSESDQMFRENHTPTLKCNSRRQSVPQYRSTSIQSALETVLHPLEKRRLSTAHRVKRTLRGHSRSVESDPLRSLADGP